MKKHDARDLNLNLDSAQLKPLFKIKPLRHALSMIFDWAVILMSIALCIQYFNPFTYILAILIIGARMHGLAILMHDASHYRFMKNRKWNDLITNVFSMYPLFLTIDQYRVNHLAHHQNLNTEEDPDWVSKLGRREFTFPTTKKEFLMIVVSYFLLIQGIKDLIWFVSRFNIIGGDDQKKVKKKKQSPIPQLLFLAILFTFLTVFGVWKYYLLFWIVPYLSTFFMFQYIRSVSEHFGDLKYDHLFSSSRTVKTNWLERFLIAPHNVGYHLEHHLYPGVPFYYLPKLHELLLETKEYRENAHLTEGYMTGLLSELT